jgi:hypothetical protein
MNNTTENTVPAMKKLTFVERALAFLKGGDDQKLARFENRVGKYFKEQIAIRERSIESLKDRITDAEEAFNDAVPNIDLARIASADGLDRYIPEYVKNLDAKLVATEELQDQIEVLEAEIARFGTIEAAIYGED